MRSTPSARSSRVLCHGVAPERQALATRPIVWKGRLWGASASCNRKPRPLQLLSSPGWTDTRIAMLTFPQFARDDSRSVLDRSCKLLVVHYYNSERLEKAIEAVKRSP